MSTTEHITGTIVENAKIHTWPHIPSMTWKVIEWWNIWPFEITTTIFSTWLFMWVLLIVLLLFNYSLKTWKLAWIKNTWLIFIKKMDETLDEFIWDKKFSRKAFFLIVWIFVFILFWNLFSLVLDWINIVSAPNTTTEYFRPINSDLNTTLVLAITVVLISQVLAISSRWPISYLKWYLFNFTWKGIWDKLVNVFVWWLHLISEFSKVLSLSLRLFWNIFAWIVLISVMSFLTWALIIFWINIWEIAVLPFWLFELFVALIQAVVFLVLTSVYFKESRSVEH